MAQVDEYPPDHAAPGQPAQFGPRGIWSRALASAALCLAIWLVFGQARHDEFVDLDDKEYVVDNPHVKSGLSGPNIAWAITHGWSSNWHPLTWISHMLDCQLYGLNPAGHHVTNIVLHAATTVLLLLLLVRMTGRFWASLLVAALFAIHPLRVESVAWVAERKDVLSGLFFMLTLLAYVAYARRILFLEALRTRATDVCPRIDVQVDAGDAAGRDAAVGWLAAGADAFGLAG